MYSFKNSFTVYVLPFNKLVAINILTEFVITGNLSGSGHHHQSSWIQQPQLTPPMLRDQRKTLDIAGGCSSSDGVGHVYVDRCISS